VGAGKQKKKGTSMTYKEFIESLKDKPIEVSRTEPLFLERHHILPVCMGGTDDDTNLILLRPEEHYIAHKLLVIENVDNQKIVYAWNQMLGGGCDTPEKYAERVKRKVKRLTDPETLNKRAETRRTSNVRYGKPPHPIDQYTTDGALVKTFDSAKEAAEEVGCAPQTILNCALGYSKTAKGFVWKYHVLDAG